MDTWRRVEVAACEELPALLGDAGPSPRTSRRSARDVHRRCRRRAREGHRPRHGGLRRCPRRRPPAPAGRWIHFGLTSSDVLDTALALQLKAVGESSCRAPTSWSPPSQGRARARRHALRRTHPWRARRADDLRGQARRLRIRGRPQPRRLRAPSSRWPSARSPAPSAPTPRPHPTSRPACSTGSASRARTSRPRSSLATATPSC